MKAVVETIADVGFQKTTAAEIARRAGVTWGAVQHHFGGKEGILLAVLEASQVTLWDARAGESGGCVQRLDGAAPGERLTGLAAARGILAAGGRDRCVTVWDARRWAPLGRWSGGLKHNLDHLQFAGVTADSPPALYAAGAGFELTCASWRTGNHGHSEFTVRGPSRWLGFDAVSRSDGAQDVVVGWCDCDEAIVMQCTLPAAPM